MHAMMKFDVRIYIYVYTDEEESDDMISHHSPASANTAMTLPANSGD